jgi:HPt (histidine-containing phosphotransfer) domain-containing protein
MPCFDPNALDELRLLQDAKDPDFFVNFMTLFLDTVSDQMVKLEALTQKQDAEALRTEAHALKSTCANAGASRMAKLCERLEQEMSHPNRKTLVGYLLEEAQAVRAEVLGLPEFINKAG